MPRRDRLALPSLLMWNKGDIVDDLGVAAARGILACNGELESFAACFAGVHVPRSISVNTPVVEDEYLSCCEPSLGPLLGSPAGVMDNCQMPLEFKLLDADSHIIFSGRDIWQGQVEGEELEAGRDSSIERCRGLVNPVRGNKPWLANLCSWELTDANFRCAGSRCLIGAI